MLDLTSLKQKLIVQHIEAFLFVGFQHWLAICVSICILPCKISSVLVKILADLGYKMKSRTNGSCGYVLLIKVFKGFNTFYHTSNVNVAIITMYIFK